MKKKLIIFLIIFGIVQVFRPSITETKYTASTDFLVLEKPSKSIENNIKNVCYDCHSNQTHYPWYQKITPINYWLNNHVIFAKKNLNFSEWNRYATTDKVKATAEMIEVLKEEKMPLKSYKLLHESANLSDSETKQLITWLEGVQIKYELSVLPVY